MVITELTKGESTLQVLTGHLWSGCRKALWIPVAHLLTVGIRKSRVSNRLVKSSRRLNTSQFGIFLSPRALHGLPVHFCIMNRHYGMSRWFFGRKPDQNFKFGYKSAKNQMNSRIICFFKNVEVNFLLRLRLAINNILPF